MSRDADGPAGERLYGLLLWIYPRRYRRRFGEAMRRTFALDRERARAAGVLARVRFWAVTVAHAVGFGLAERGRSLWSGDADSGTVPGRPPLLDSVGADLRFALRLMARSPVFTATAVLSLAVGIAGTTTIFGLTDALLFRPSPGITGADRLVDIARTNGGGDYSTMSYPMFRHLREHARSLEAISAATTLQPAPMSLRRAATGERVFARTVSHSFFDVLGMRPARGRFFLPDEDVVADARPVVVLSHAFWQGRLQGDPEVLQRSLELNGVDFQVVGVAAPGFDGVTIVGTDVWVPMAMAPTVFGRPAEELLEDPETLWHRALGRLAPGVSVAAARTELDALMEGFLAEHPELPGSWGVRVQEQPGRLPVPMRAAFGAFTGVLFLLTGGLLAVACSNVAAMLLARATARRQEMATRRAMGAGRGQLLRQMLTETLVLFLGAGALALPLTVWIGGLLRGLLPALPFPMSLDLSLSVRGAVFAGGIALVAGLAFGLAPARHALRPDLARAMGGRTSTTGRRRLRLRHGLVVAQVALSLAMVITAGLFVRTLQAAAEIDPGFETAGVQVVSLDTSPAAVGPAAASLLERVADEVRGVPGVGAVGYARQLPLQGSLFGIGGVRVPGVDQETAARLDAVSWDVVSPGYFRAVGLPLIAGRGFRDDDGSRPVAIVNETFARAAWPGGGAVGRQFWLERGDDDVAYEVIGVAGDARYRMINEDRRPFAYVSFGRYPQTQAHLFVRTAEGRSLAADVRAAVARAEPALPIIQIQSFDDAVAVGLLPQRLAAWIAGAVGGLGGFLAMLGIYGLTAFLVARRTREIAIRMALGASRGAVRGLVLRQAARDGLIGAVLGMALAAGLGVVVQRMSLLVDVTPLDPLTFGIVGLLAAAGFLVAGYLPTRQATSTDAVGALRAE